MEFEKYITDKFLNGNGIAKYTGMKKIKLIHEKASGQVMGRKTFTIGEYEKYLYSIDDNVDDLAYMLDDLFGCHMLN